MYKNHVSDGGINVPVSTWEFPLFRRVIFQREASFGSLFVTVYSTVICRQLGDAQNCKHARKEPESLVTEALISAFKCFVIYIVN